MSNYRPITTLPVLSKIFEKLMHVRLYSFFDEFKVICKSQFGFRAGLSTADALLEYINEAYDSLNDSKYFFTVFIDFSRAFDTVNHGLLLRKLEHMGIRGTTLGWLESFLTDRYQHVSVDGATSGLRPINIGVPQGSTLGPLLFILYINDLHRVSNYCSVLHFADDTTLHYSHLDFHSAVSNINDDLQRVCEWLHCNRLSINVQKTNYMIITNRSIPPGAPVKMGSSVLLPVNKAKFLGVTIDDRLTFSDHVQGVVGRLSRGLGVMRKLSSVLPPSTLKSLFYSLVYCHIVYALPAWGNVGRTVVGRVSGVLDRAVGLLSSDLSVEDSYKHFNILNFENTVFYFNVIYFYKALHGDEYSYFCVRLHNNQIGHLYSTRFQTDLKFLPPFYKKSKCQNAFLFNSTHNWNGLPLQLREISSLHKFKREVKKFLTDG